MSLPDAFHEIAKRVNNWGRWGADDEIGTLNLITDEVVREAAACVRSGRRIPLALPLQQDGVQTGMIPGRVNPLHTMVQINQEIFGPGTVACSDDAVTMGLQAATHWDALTHVSHSGRIYNGRPAGTITPHGGAEFSGIDKARHIVSRGVLLDVARARGVTGSTAGTRSPRRTWRRPRNWRARACVPVTSCSYGRGRSRHISPATSTRTATPRPACRSAPRSGSTRAMWRRWRTTPSRLRYFRRRSRICGCPCTRSTWWRWG